MNLLIILSTVLFLSDGGYTQNCVLSHLPPKSNSGCCGHAVDGEKSSGTVTRIGEYPWMGIIEYRSKDKIRLLCGAVLISGRYVLSSGNCFSDAALKVGTPINIRLGEYDVNNDGPDCVNTTGKHACTDGAISIPIEKYTVHPDYKRTDNNRRNDIVLIRLATMAPYTDFIRPICMPSLDITLKAPKNLYMTVAGWGAVNKTVSRSNVLRRVHVPYVDFYLCRHKYNTTRFRYLLLSNGQLCAGSKNRDSCQGDSGGPLMLLKGQTTELAGIVSFGPTPCGLDTVPGVYTKVFAYNDWITKTIENDEQASMKTTQKPVTTLTTSTEKEFISDLIVFRE